MDTLDAIRINQFGKFKTIKEYYPSVLKGLMEIGIRKNSEEYYKAQDILHKQNLSSSLIMIENSLNSNYVRVI